MTKPDLAALAARVEAGSGNYWVSWYSDLMGKFELHWPWWVSGSRMSDDAETMVAAVKADNEEAAKRIIIDCHDEPKPADLEWRFVEERPADWSPFSGRFPKAGWMQWPLVAQQQDRQTEGDSHGHA